VILVPFTFLATGHVVLYAPSDERRARLMLAVPRLAVLGFTSLAVSLPYRLPVFSRYQFQMLNRAPMHDVGLSIPEILYGTVSLSFVLALLGGYGLGRLSERFSAATGLRIVFMGLVASLITIQIPTYLNTADHGLFREESIAKANRKHMVALYDWMLSNTGTERVFLADGFLDLADEYDFDHGVEADAALPEYRFEFEGVTTLALAMEAPGIRL
jgi:hypothetical protein